MALLVDLDREHAAVAAAVVERAHRPAEALVQERDLGIEDVLDAEQDRHLQAALLHAGDDVEQAHPRAAAVERDADRDRAVVGEIEVARPPPPDAVELGRLGHAPARCEVCFQFACSRFAAGRSRPSRGPDLAYRSTKDQARSPMFSQGKARDSAGRGNAPHAGSRRQIGSIRSPRDSSALCPAGKPAAGHASCCPEGHGHRDSPSHRP